MLERKILLDYIIRQFTNKTPLRKIELKTLIILRMGVYQLLFMDKIPQAAAVNEAVNLAKSLRLVKSAGFINAVLRAFVNNGCKYRLPDDRIEKMSVEYSCPIEIIKLLCGDYGEEICLTILKLLNGRPPLNIRVNTLAVSAEELIKALEGANIATERAEFPDNALTIDASGSLERLAEFRQGRFHIQDLSSQLCVSLMSLREDYTVLDACSGPGGKSFTAAQYMNNKGRIIACDIYPHKLALIESGAKRLGIKNISTVLRDSACDGAPENMPQGGFDRVLCDTPCSGLGIMRRKPEIRYKKDLGIDNLSDLQYDILCNNAKFVKCGGLLIYSTCTLNRRENNDNADRFLSEHPDFAPEPLKLPNGVERLIEEPENQLTLFPQKNGCDGFFIALFRRRASDRC